MIERVEMKLQIRKLGSILVGLTLVSGLCYGVWILGKSFVESLTAASPEVTAAIVGAMATVFVGVSAVLISQAHERRRSTEEAHRLKKVEIYQGFIDVISRMIGSSNESLSVKALEPDELVNYLFRFKSDILLWGSPRVIKAQINFETLAGKGDMRLLFNSVNELYVAIREDIGLSNLGLNRLELVKLYLNEEARTQLR